MACNDKWRYRPVLKNGIPRKALIAMAIYKESRIDYLPWHHLWPAVKFNACAHPTIQPHGNPMPCAGPVRTKKKEPFHPETCFCFFFKVSLFRSIFSGFIISSSTFWGNLGLPNQRARGLEDVSTIANAEAGFAGQIRWRAGGGIFLGDQAAMFSLWCR